MLRRALANHQWLRSIVADGIDWMLWLMFAGVGGFSLTGLPSPRSMGPPGAPRTTRYFLMHGLRAHLGPSVPVRTGPASGAGRA
eukprot:9472113-Pyramimonas_sp.AAC.2